MPRFYFLLNIDTCQPSCILRSSRRKRERLGCTFASVVLFKINITFLQNSFAISSSNFRGGGGFVILQNGLYRFLLIYFLRATYTPRSHSTVSNFLISLPCTEYLFAFSITVMTTPRYASVEKRDVKYTLSSLLCPSLTNSFSFPISLLRINDEIGIIYQASVSPFIRTQFTRKKILLDVL